MRREGARIRPIRRFKLKNSVKIILFALAVFLFALANNLFAADEPNRVVTQHVVKSGETYWQLAERYYPERDPREMTSQLKSWNQKSSGQLQPGEVILIYHQ